MSQSSKTVISAVAPIALLTILILFILSSGPSFLQFGTVLPEIYLEKIDFVDSEIHVTVRNTGPVDVNVVVADVNDRIQPAAIEPDNHLTRFETALVRIPYDWNEGQPYAIGLTTNDGTRFEKVVDAAFPALQPNGELIGYFALIGAYVGIIPVMIGLLWLPFIKKLSQNKYQFFLAFTIGLLLFLAFDSLEEAFEISQNNLDDSFNGALLIGTVTILTFFGLYFVSSQLLTKTRFSRISAPVSISLMVAIGIGFHNLGEGLAIGAAVGLGNLALSTFLIVGFAIHNTTEGFAIVAPLSKTKSIIPKLVGMGLIAGTPAIFGAWIGGFFFSPFSAIIFLAIGAGAIFQVIISIILWQKKENNFLSNWPLMLGISLGLVVMYLTSIFI
jgi:zinc transporter ZupT|tara:strand:- start:627 stop:1787 length:1161 start_codon:yes stop_codon:yes gene_type:complete